MTETANSDPLIELDVPGFPDFDADALVTAAALWTDVANGLRSTVDTTQLQVNGVSSEWTGGAREAFAAEWAALAGAIQEFAGELDKVAADLIHSAHELETHKREYDQIMLELGISALVSVGVALFTSGGGALITGVNAIRLVNRAKNIISLVLAMSARFVVAAAGGSMRAIAARFVINAGFDLSFQMAGNVVDDPAGNPLRGVSPKDVTLTSVIGFVLPFHGKGNVVFRGAANNVTTEGVIQLYREHKLDAGGLFFAGVLGAGTAKIPNPFGKRAPKSDLAPGGPPRSADPTPPPRGGNDLPTDAHLGRQYVGENDPNNPDRYFRPKVVHYMTPEEREAHRVFVDADGNLRSAGDGSLFDTSTGRTAWSGGGRAIFVMDGSGNLFASLEQDVGRIHHSSLLGGEPVAGAGEIEVRDGKLVAMTDQSGHYTPDAQLNDRVLQSLRDQGLMTDPDFKQYGWRGAER